MTTAVARAGRFRLERVIGRGGMSLVYLAHDDRTGDPVAVKVLADNLAVDPELRHRFRREGELAKRLSHPNVVRVLDSGETGERAYIVFEYVEGRSLAEELHAEGRIAPERAAELGAQAAAGLAHAHERGLVHRDVKPHNLLLARDGTLKVSDFGIARLVEGTELTQIGTVLGTAAYLAPEQAAGESATPAADVYGLGAVLYELLTGMAPYAAGSITELVARRAQDDLPRPGALADGVPDELDSLVLACLDADPARRPTASEAELVLRGESPAPTRITPPASERPTTVVHRPLPRRRPAIAASVLALALAIGLGIGLTGGGGAAHSSPPRAAAVRPVAPVPSASTPAGRADQLAAWLRNQAK